MTDKAVVSLQKGSGSSSTASASTQQMGVIAFSSEQASIILETISRLDSSKWFTTTVDLNLPLYTTRVPYPCDFPMIRDKIRKRKYQTADQFALDMRRVFGNCLRYNFSVVDSQSDIRDTTITVRADAKASLFKFEQEWIKLYGNDCAPVSEL